MALILVHILSVLLVLALLTHGNAIQLVQPFATPFVTYKDYDPENSPTRAGPENVQNLEEGRGDMFMHYMPDYNIVLCTCAKCGSTSLYEYAYELAFGKSWASTYNDTMPWAQDVLSERWENKIIIVNDTTEQDRIMETAYSFAVIRDPKERLISAWKSKLACDASYGVDVEDRSYFVHDENGISWPRGFVFGFQKIYGAEENISCLDFRMFLNGLVDIHLLGRSKFLDRHFLPQDEGCFSRHPASMWSRVTTISSQEAFDELAEQMGAQPLPMFWTHKSEKKISLADNVLDEMDFFTAKEYAMLGPYLPEGYGSRSATGEYLIQGRHTTKMVSAAIVSGNCSCAEGEKILDVDSCKAAAQYLGVTFNKNVRLEAHSNGCARLPDGIYFNDHPTGGCSDFDHAVCSIPGE